MFKLVDVMTALTQLQNNLHYIKVGSTVEPSHNNIILILMNKSNASGKRKWLSNYLILI